MGAVAPLLAFFHLPFLLTGAAATFTTNQRGSHPAHPSPPIPAAPSSPVPCAAPAPPLSELVTLRCAHPPPLFLPPPPFLVCFALQGSQWGGPITMETEAVLG